ncbi:hypothetical protein N7U66_06230 [Lacinutrix neustonica]|uniref:tRNA_anti-like n=1 Tax=Lacinutrix neustonica TaxID=2980107 RepID=A0A9E8SHZ0_9FLAO|nr:hypothetical protein [Lacinutrix neustonica]WAC03185.1 hypothetical protein N7U66_06230 [Lacinutrix neustonica]
MKRSYWVILSLIIILAIIAYNVVYQKHRIIEEETVAFSLNADDLINAFQNNSTLAESKFLNQTIQINGDVSEINTSNLTLNDVIFCSFNADNNLQKTELNTKISIKGRCIGYDDLLEQVKFDQCSISQ